MANSSWFSTSNQYIKYRIEVTQNSQNITNNTSNVTVKVWIYRTNTGYTTYGSGTCYCKINGTTYSASITSSQKITNSGIYLFSKTLDIGHNSDGSKSLTCSAWFSHDRFSSSEQSASFGLTTIPRASNITSITGGTIGSSMTVNVDRKSSSFTTSVWLFLGNQTWVNVAHKSTATSITFTVPTSLANAIPNATSGTGQVRIRTYNGDTQIGSDVSWNKEFSVPNYSPSIGTFSVSETGSGVGVYVQGKSKIKYSGAASTSYGASITSYTWKIGSATLSSASGTTGTWGSSGNVNISLTVKDSRGKTASKSTTINFVPYSKPVAKISAFRCNDAGNADTNGNKVRATITGTVASVGGKNTIKIVVQAQDKTTGSWGGTREYTSNQTNTVLTLNGYDTNKSYELKISVTDKWTTSTASVTISTSYVTLDLRAEGRGLAIGKVSEKDAFEVSMEEFLRGSLNFVAGAERQIKHENADTYLYFHNPTGGTYQESDLGCYHRNVGVAWKYDSVNKQLLLRSGYGTQSDKRLKYDYDEFENWDDFYNFYMSLRPMKFKYINEMQDITYMGLLAQDVADSLVDNNLNNEKLALVRATRNDDMDDGREYNLAYQELISLNIKMIQKHEKELLELNNIIFKQQEVISQLEDMVNQLINQGGK